MTEKRKDFSPAKIMIIGVSWFVIGFGACAASMFSSNVFSSNVTSPLMIGILFLVGVSGCVALVVSVVTAIVRARHWHPPAEDDQSLRQADDKGKEG